MYARARFSATLIFHLCPIIPVEMPNADPQQEFTDYIMKHAEFYSVLKAPVYMKILTILVGDSITLDELHAQAPRIERNDLELIIKSLEALKLVGQHSTDERIIYYVTDTARDLLEKYNKIKGAMKV